MLLYIIIALIVIIPVVVAVNSRSYDRAENFYASLTMCAFLGAFIFGLFCMGGNSARNVVVSEKTYTIAEKSAPVYDNGDLSFSYVDGDQIKTWNGTITKSTIPVESPKQIKIVGYDSVVPWIAPWPLGYNEKAEFIR